jgi:triphosphoribosyl-dephospho-CoA synthase
VLRLGGAASEPGLRALNELDGALIEAGLSPGGSADMLAAGLFLVTTENVLGVASISHPQDKRCRRIA